MKDKVAHIPVLLDEVINYLRPVSGGIYVDATVGSGGHAEGILEKSGPDGKLIGIDIDPFILEIAGKRLEKFGGRCLLFGKNYIELPFILRDLNIESMDGIIFDLGVNIEHFEIAERGFSFLREGPLDMRFNPNTKITAEEIINEWKAEKLIRILCDYGEERKAKRIVEYLLKGRKKKRIKTTLELAELIVGAVGWRRGGKIHPATKVFQALRIAVNNELRNIEGTLPEAVNLLRPGGRICVISFHSLEDRIVKNTFRLLSKSCICPPEVEICVCGNKPKIKIITKKPIVPGRDELVNNTRARSAKLRVAEKI